MPKLTVADLRDQVLDFALAIEETLRDKEADNEHGSVDLDVLSTELFVSSEQVLDLIEGVSDETTPSARQLARLGLRVDAVDCACVLLNIAEATRDPLDAGYLG